MNKIYGEGAVRVWADYLEALPKAPAEALGRNLHAYGFLPPALAARCAAAIKAAPDALYAAKSYRSAWTDAPEAPGNAHKALDARTAWVLAEAVAMLAEPVQALVGAPWRLLTARSWITYPGAEGGPYEEHTDGEPAEMLKVMLYWTATGGTGGGLEIDSGGGARTLLAGPPGLWVLLYNSRLTHRAVAPTVGERIATELTLCPWPHMDTRLRTLGANVRHPIFPLVNERDML